MRWLTLTAVCLALLLGGLYAGARIAHAYQQGLPVDMLIFVNAARNYHKTGQLYQRHDHLQEAYRPGARLYKFPPAFQLFIAPWLPEKRLGRFFVTARTVIIALYWLAIAVLIRSLWHWGATRLPPMLPWLWGIVAVWFFPWHKNLVWITAEVPLLATALLALRFQHRHPILAGCSLGLLAAIKIYPVFLLLAFLYERNGKALLGVGLGFCLTTATAISYFGWSEHRFYLTAVLPVLLQEPTILHPQNLNPVTRLGVWGWLSADTVPLVANGLRTLVMLVTVGLLAATRKYALPRPLVTALLMATLLLFLPNYWDFYLVWTLPAIFLLLTIALQQHNRWLLGATGLATLPLLIDAFVVEQIMRQPALLHGPLADMTRRLHWPDNHVIAVQQALLPGLALLVQLTVLSAPLLWGLLVHQGLRYRYAFSGGPVPPEPPADCPRRSLSYRLSAAGGDWLEVRSPA